MRFITLHRASLTLQDQQKAYRREEKLANELNKLKAELEAATAKRQGLDNELEAKKAESERLRGETQSAKQRLEELQAKVS